MSRSRVAARRDPRRARPERRGQDDADAHHRRPDASRRGAGVVEGGRPRSARSRDERAARADGALGRPHLVPAHLGHREPRLLRTARRPVAQGALAAGYRSLEAVGLTDVAQAAGGHLLPRHAEAAVDRASVATEPPILVFDEATHDLDPAGAHTHPRLVAARPPAGPRWSGRPSGSRRSVASATASPCSTRARVRFPGTVPEFIAQGRPAVGTWCSCGLRGPDPFGVLRPRRRRGRAGRARSSTARRAQVRDVAGEHGVSSATWSRRSPARV